MAHDRQRRARVSITLPPDLWQEIQDTAAQIEGDTPSTIIETIVRRSLTPYKLQRKPEIVGVLERARFNLAAAKRERERQIREEEYDGDIEEEIKQYQLEILEELERQEVERLMNEQSRKK